MRSQTTEKNEQPAIKIGIDIGGTFTDFVIYNPQSQEIDSFKLPSTPADPAEAVLQGLALILEPYNRMPGIAVQAVHGSTVATNALLERKGARTALVATRGFADLLQIGRQNRPELYNLFADPPEPLAPPDLRFEVDERVTSEGSVMQAPGDLEGLVKGLLERQVESVAVCLLFSFLHPAHEAQVGERLRQGGLQVSLSSEILPEFREYERASTTAVNAYVSPVLHGYLTSLEQALKGEKSVRLRVMQSNGGSMSLAEARRYGVRCILSGPAGGIVGAWQVASLIDPPHRQTDPPGNPLNVITFDMGGTSTDVALITGEPGLTTEAVIGGCPIRIPVLDIHTIGAGGGSIARVDAGGALRVGPESSGADPGPACYGRGRLPTVTDANLVLGRLDPDYFLGGQMRLDFERAALAMAELGRAAGLSAVEAALGVVEVANAHMEHALRVISVERGHDPRLFFLLAFGGAGGLHAADLARQLGAPRLIVPPLAATLSALGMLSADVIRDHSQTVMLPGDAPLEAIEAVLDKLATMGRQEILDEGIPGGDIVLERSLDLRYRGQSYELNLPYNPDFIEGFHQRHAAVYGYDRREAQVQIVNLRVRAVGRIERPFFKRLESSASQEQALLAARPVYFRAGRLETAIYLGEKLPPGSQVAGPALVLRRDTTILLCPGDRGEVDEYGNLIVAIAPIREAADD